MPSPWSSPRDEGTTDRCEGGEDDQHAHPIDKHRVPPIHQKRLLAFVNSFIVETVDFLNKFITDCDLKFVAFETKLRKVEDTLSILESKLFSIPELRSLTTATDGDTVDHKPTEDPPSEIIAEAPSIGNLPSSQLEPTGTTAIQQPEADPNGPTGGVKASEDYRYKKFFKMIHFGVLPQAVRNKLASEGLDPNILDEPNRVLEDGRRTPPPCDDDDEEDSS